ncbi:MAG TPA: META domain-containing protein [Pyrinomonadaceae bacterium]
MKKLLILVTVITASVAASFAQTERIGTRQWKLVQLEGSSVASTSRAYLELEAQQTRFTGHTGCNRMFGTVAIHGRRLDFSNIGTTRMACTEPRVRRVETAFLRALENADRYRARGNTLELYDRNRMVARLVASAKQDPDNGGQVSRLGDRKWMLEAIKGVPVSRAGRTAFLNFDEMKRSVGGDSSCNVFGGAYTAAGSTLRITDVISTMRACEEDNRMIIEREFLDGLRQANRYEIARGKLMLYRNQRLLLTLVGQRK